MRSTQKTETSSAGKQNPSTTEKKPLKVKVETVLIIIAMTGLVLTGITIGNRIHHHQMLRDNGCKYCYANFNDEKVKENVRLYNQTSPLLCGNINLEDKITDRKVKSFKDAQLSFFEY